jgi:hypothetical protein
MSKSKLSVWAALAVSCAPLSLGAAQAQETLHEGLTYPQFKSILGQANLKLEEHVTQKGNRYLMVMVPGATTAFVATVSDCGQGQDQACDGFAYFYVEPTRTMTATAMGQFNRANHFIKAMPGTGDASLPLIAGESLALGGVSARYVITAAAYFAVALEAYHQSGVVAMTGPGAATIKFAPRMQPEQLFAEFAAKGAGKPLPVAHKIDDALIDAIVAGRR